MHNIKYTRSAYGLDKINNIPFNVSKTLDATKLGNSEQIINNIRLWNPEPLKATFKQLQEIRLYYEFNNVDVDRYMINGKPQQVMLSARELDINQLSSQAKTWINEHLIYTHGYGACMTPVNKITPEGLPEFYIKDIPPVSNIEFNITRPEIYFGEKILPTNKNYFIVNTKQKEFDYPTGNQNAYTSYQGKGGIQLDTTLKKAVYSLYFSDLNSMKIEFGSDLNPSLTMTLTEKSSPLATLIFSSESPIIPNS